MEKKRYPMAMPPSTSEIVFSRSFDGIHRNVDGKTLKEWRIEKGFEQPVKPQPKRA